MNKYPNIYELIFLNSAGFFTHIKDIIMIWYLTPTAILKGDLFNFNNNFPAATESKCSCSEINH